IPEHVAARLALRQHQLLLAQAVPEGLGLRRHRIRQRAIDLHGSLLGVRRAEPSRRSRTMSRQRVASKLWLPEGRGESQKYGYHAEGGNRDADERTGVPGEAARALSAIGSPRPQPIAD